MNSRSQPKEPTQAELAQTKQELQATQTKLQHVKSELAKTDILKQRADESLAVYLSDISSKKTKAEKDFNRLKNNYELDIAAYPDVIHDLENQKDSILQSIADAIGELKILQSNIELQIGVLEKIEEQKNLALIAIEDADGVLIELEEEIDDKKDSLKDTTKLLEVGTVQLAKLKESITATEIELTNLRADLQTRKNAIEDDMKITIQKSSDVIKRLIELEQRESRINIDISNRTKALELREQVVARKERKMSDLEVKAQQYAKFMKL